jgi:hypothetical protein
MLQTTPREAPKGPMKKRIFLLGMTKGHVVTHNPFHDTKAS